MLSPRVFLWLAEPGSTRGKLRKKGRRQAHRLGQKEKKVRFYSKEPLSSFEGPLPLKKKGGGGKVPFTTSPAPIPVTKIEKKIRLPLESQLRLLLVRVAV